MNPLPTRLLAATAALIACSGAATAATYTFQQGAANYAGTADTGLRATDPDTPLGEQTELSIDASDGGLPSHALLRFDGLFGTAVGSIAAGSAITSATLTLDIVSAGSGIRAFDMLVAWNETTATWNSTGNGIQADGIEAALLPTVEIGGNNGGTNVQSGPLVLDVTASLQRWASGTVPVQGWALLPFMPDGTNGVDFVSSEAPGLASRPLLTVQVSPVPEPAGLLLAALGSVGLLMRRRLGRR